MRKRKLFGKSLVSLALIATMTAGQAVPALADSRVPQVLESVEEGASLPENTSDISEGDTIDQSDISDPENPGGEQDADWNDSSSDSDGTADTDLETDEIEPETEEAAPDAEEPEFDKEEAMKLMAEVISSEDGYISELKIAYDKDESKAKQKLVDAGYKVIDQNLNKDADSLLSTKKAVYLGYKTTTEKKDAIRDIAALGQYDNYIVMEYDEILQQQYSALATVEADLIAMIGDFQKQYAAGSKTAESAYKLMNLYREDDSDMLLGDWLLNVSLNPSSDNAVSPVMKLISQISSTALCSIEFALAMGVSTGENVENSYATKLYKMSASDIKKAKADKSLYEKAAIIDESLEDFSEKIQIVRDYPEIPAETTWEELSEEQLSYASEYFTLQAIDMYVYEDEKLSEFLCDDLSIKDLYPLASVMTDGQLAAVKYVGLWTSLSFDTMNYLRYEPLADAIIEAATEERIRQQMEEMQKIYGGDGITSIYFGVDRELFEGKIAVTKDALDAAGSSGDYSKLFGTDGIDKKDLTAALALGYGALGLGATVGLSMIFSNAAKQAREVLEKELGSITLDIELMERAVHSGPINSRLAELAVMEPEMYQLQLQNDADCLSGLYEEFNKVKQEGEESIRELTKYSKMAAGLAVVIGVVFLVVAALEIYDIIESYHPKYDVNDIPQAVFHHRYDEKTGQTYYVRYRCVTDLSGNPGDVNGYVGQAYKILYTTKYVDAGEALTATIEAQSIAENETSYGKSDDYLGIHKSGYSLATDLNENAFNSKAPKIYVYFKKDC